MMADPHGLKFQSRAVESSADVETRDAVHRDCSCNCGCNSHDNSGFSGRWNTRGSPAFLSCFRKESVSQEQGDT